MTGSPDKNQKSDDEVNPPLSRFDKLVGIPLLVIFLTIAVYAFAEKWFFERNFESFGDGYKWPARSNADRLDEEYIQKAELFCADKGLVMVNWRFVADTKIRAAQNEYYYLFDCSKPR